MALEAEVEIGEGLDCREPRRTHRGLEAARIAELDVGAEELIHGLAAGELPGVTAANQTLYMEYANLPEPR